MNILCHERGYFRISFRGISTHAELEIKSMQSNGPVSQCCAGMKRKALKIISFHLNIGRKKQNNNTKHTMLLYFLFYSILKTRCSLSESLFCLIWKDKHAQHALLSRGEVNIVTPGGRLTGSPGVDRKCQSGRRSYDLTSVWPES